MSYVHILTSINVSTERPIQLSPEFSLAKASPEQVAEITKFFPTSFAVGARPYEWGNYQIDEVGLVTGASKLPPDQWRYFIFTFRGTQNYNQLEELGQGMLLLEPSIELGLKFGVMGGEPPDSRLDEAITKSEGGTVSSNPNYISSFANEVGTTMSPPLEVTQEFLLEGMNNFEQIKACSDKTTKDALLAFEQLRALPKLSPLRILSCFSILVTHNPKLEANFDSLTHQVKTKMPLLSRFFAKGPVPTSKLLPDNPEKIWSMLYKWRSQVAHGISPDEKEEHLKKLGKPADALRYLTDNLKRLLLFAMSQPELIRDLKKV